MLASPAAAEAVVGWAPCPQPEAPTLQCGALPVPLDRSGAVPGAISLNVRRVPATTAPGDSAVLALAGGPGQAAAPLAATFAQILAPARTTRDLLVMDQRGTGGSGALTCPALSTPSGRESLRDAGASCAAQLGPRRGFFTTSDTVPDIEALRDASGYARLTIYAVSYGTKVALAYAAAHPDRVERLVLDSVVTPEGPDVLQRSTFAAIPRVLGELCAGNACQGITANPTATLSSLVKRLARRPLRARYVDSRGRRHGITITRQDLLTMLLKGDTNPALRAEVPAALGSLRRGDRGPLARLVAHTGRARDAGGTRRVRRPGPLRRDDVRGGSPSPGTAPRTGARGRGRPRGSSPTRRRGTSRRSIARRRWAPSCSACACAGPSPPRPRPPSARCPPCRRSC